MYLIELLTWTLVCFNFICWVSHKKMCINLQSENSKDHCSNPILHNVVVSAAAVCWDLSSLWDSVIVSQLKSVKNQINVLGAVPLVCAQWHYMIPNI